MTIRPLTAFVNLLVALSPAYAAGGNSHTILFPIIDLETADRCSADSLSPEEAIARVNWSVRCGYLRKIKAQGYLYDDDGQTLARPMYPIFVTADHRNIWASAPRAEGASCDKPPEYDHIVACTSACYAPGTKVAFVDENELSTSFWMPIEVALKKQLKVALTLSQEATLDELRFTATPVKGYSKEFKDAWNDILVVKTESGGSIKVTPNHPLLDGDGKMREAGSLKPTESLVRMDGLKDPIVSIEKTRHFGQVYNLDTRTKSLQRKIVVADGYLNGTYYYQNQGFGYMNRVMLREQIPTELLE